MDISILNDVKIADKYARYDTYAKSILSRKGILARIMKGLIKEYANLQLEEIARCIEGDGQYSPVPTEPGCTNSVMSQRIHGMNTEDNVCDEGVDYFDILFTASLPNTEGQKRVKIIINVEPQQKRLSERILVNRSIFYASRMISSQKTRTFEKDNYGDIQAVYSIWLCMSKADNNIHHIHFTDDVTPLVPKVLKSGKQKNPRPLNGNLSLVNIFFVNLTDELPDLKGNLAWNRLMCTLFSKIVKPEDKLRLLKNEYNIVDQKLLEEVHDMSSMAAALVEETWEKAVEETWEKAVEETVEAEFIANVKNMASLGVSADMIAKFLRRSETEVKEALSSEVKVKADQAFASKHDDDSASDPDIFSR